MQWALEIVPYAFEIMRCAFWELNLCNNAIKLRNLLNLKGNIQ
jgi:hypothetical protein